MPVVFGVEYVFDRDGDLDILAVVVKFDTQNGKYKTSVDLFLSKNINGTGNFKVAYKLTNLFESTGVTLSCIGDRCNSCYHSLWAWGSRMVTSVSYELVSK